MAERTWQKAFLLAAVGMALAAGCTINSEDGDDDDGEAGSGGTTSGTGGKGGSSGSAGKGGSSGSGGTAGTTGGTAGKGGSAGTGGSAGKGGTAGTGGSDAGAAGAVNDETAPLCDPDSGELPSTPYPTCEPAEGEETEPCAVCIEENCCEESKSCYAYDPGNVCGWGGPAEGGEYLGGGEIGCFRTCILDFVEENGAYDPAAEEACVADCATETDSAGMDCGGLIGNATSELIGCMHLNCETACFE